MKKPANIQDAEIVTEEVAEEAPKKGKGKGKVKSNFSKQITDTVKNLAVSLTEKNLKVVDMSEELTQLKLALLTKEHLFIEGEPGSAKSMLAHRAFGSIRNSETFDIHMSKETTDDAIFGPVDIQKFRDEKEYVRNTDGYILDADLVFLDEFFDASEDTMRTLLTVLNERRWIRGRQVVMAKLHTAIATANYSQMNDKTKAVIDRFIFKAKSKGEFSKEKMIEVYESYLSAGEGFIADKFVDFKNLKEVSDKLCNDENFIKISSEMISVYYDVVKFFKEESGKFISKRVENKGLKVVKANALLNGRNEVDVEDLKALVYILTMVNDKTEKKVFDAAFSKAAASVKIKQELKKSIDLALRTSAHDVSNFPASKLLAFLRSSDVMAQKMQTMYSTAENAMSSTEKDEYKKAYSALQEKLEKLRNDVKALQEESMKVSI